MDRIATKVDWRKVLRYFVKTSQRADKRSTPRRLNKRFPKIHPGKRVRRQAKIAVSIDQSGSVDDGMLAAFFSELNKLAEIAEFTVIPFDTQVAESKIYTWKKGQSKKTEEAEKSRNWGSVSSSMRSDIMDRIATKVDWRKVLRYFVKTSQRADKRSTPRRLNKRFPKVHPGKRVRRQAKIVTGKP